MAILAIEHFTKCYKGTHKAVDDLSLRVEAGDIYGFIGHNGAGKTTTIKAVTGVMDFSDGEIQVDGLSLKKDPVACKQKMAYIPDNPDIYGYMTGVQYLNFIGDMFSIAKEERIRLIQHYAQRLEIADNLGDLISTYSHGMKQKAVIIAALIHSPKLLVMDEPFVGLDPKASYTLKEIMHEECEKGSAIFFSTHVLEVAEKLCNKIAIIKEGKLIASGTTDEVRGKQSLEDVFLELIEDE